MAPCQNFPDLADELKANGWCLDRAGSQWSRYCPDFSRRATLQEVQAFIAASRGSQPRYDAVVKKMEQLVPLEEVVRGGTMKSVYDCLPELRVNCFDAVVAVYTGRDTRTVFEEWGEWVDSAADQATTDLVSELLALASARGFDLLTDEELEKGQQP